MVTAIPGLDCSDEAQAIRQRQLNELLAKLRSGVSAVSDRGRSVTYRGRDDLWPVIQQLQQEMAACQLGYWPTRRRLAYIDLVKGY
jgi:hypothetical protein